LTSDFPKSLREGRYAIIGVLGEGSQGATLDAVDKREGRAVAIKRFQVRGARSWKDVELAEREARVLGSLSHPLLPAHVEHFEEDGALCLVMEKVEGETLGALLGREGRLAPSEVLRFLGDAAEVLDYLHGCAPPVIHRDIKPNNVIRRPDGRFALVDFGSVRARLEPKGGSTVVGTFGYMAPEQLQGRALPATDVYAVGATAMALLSGTEPEDLPHQGLAIDVRRALGRRADRRLVAALEAMLVPDPDKRAASLRPLLAELSPERPPSSSPGAARASASSADASASPSAASAEEPQQRRPDEARSGRQRRADGKRGPPRHWQAHRGAWLPPLVAVMVVIGFSLARMVVALGLRVVVPLLLALLSVVFGAALMRAARATRQAGRNAGKALARAQARVRGRRARGDDRDARPRQGARQGAPPRGHWGRRWRGRGPGWGWKAREASAARAEPPEPPKTARPRVAAEPEDAPADGRGWRIQDGPEAQDEEAQEEAQALDEVEQALEELDDAVRRGGRGPNGR